MTTEDIEKRIRNCSACELGKEEKVRVPGIGSTHPEIVFVGECPGRREKESGKPFSGPTKGVIDEALTEIGLSEDRIWKTLVLKCPTPNFRNPYDKEISTCGMFLRDEIKMLNPKAILAMGRVPSFYFTGSRATVDELRGKVRYYRSWPLIITYHPQAVKRFPFLKAKFLADLKLLQSDEVHKSREGSLEDIRKKLSEVFRRR